MLFSVVGTRRPEKGSSIASLEVVNVIYSLHHRQESLGKFGQLRVEERWIILIVSRIIGV